MGKANINSRIGPTSPLPFLRKLRNLLFGKVKPPLMVKITVYIQTLVLFLFSAWGTISYFALLFSKKIVQNQNFEVNEQIKIRGATLGFEPNEFLHKTLFFSGYGLVFWPVLFVIIILIYRQVRLANLLILIFWLVYFGIIILYFNWKYIDFEMSYFDKTLIIISIIFSLICMIFVKAKTFKFGNLILEEEI